MLLPSVPDHEFAYALPGSRLPVSVRCLHAFALLRGIAIPSAHLKVSRQEKQSTNMSVFAVCFPASSLILCLLSLYYPPAHFWSICLTAYLTVTGLQSSASQALPAPQRNCLAQNELLPVSVGIFHLLNLPNCQPSSLCPWVCEYVEMNSMQLVRKMVNDYKL